MRGALRLTEGADYIVALQGTVDVVGVDAERRHAPGIKPDTHCLRQTIVHGALHVGKRRKPRQNLALNNVADLGIGPGRRYQNAQIKAGVWGVGAADFDRGILGTLRELKTNLAQSGRELGQHLGGVLIEAQPQRHRTDPCRGDRLHVIEAGHAAGDPFDRFGDEALNGLGAGARVGGDDRDRGTLNDRE